MSDTAAEENETAAAEPAIRSTPPARRIPEAAIENAGGVGNVILYWKGIKVPAGEKYAGDRFLDVQPEAALVTKVVVWSPDLKLVNLAVFDSSGLPRPELHVRLVRPETLPMDDLKPICTLPVSQWDWDARCDQQEASQEGDAGVADDDPVKNPALHS